MEIKLDIGSADIQSMINKLTLLGVAVDSTAYSIVKTCTDKLMEESVKRAPFKEGFLQDSHEKTVLKAASAAEVVGYVYIPSNAPASDYALYMHERDYKLGPTSEAKQARVGVVVGRKYLERAFYENRAKFEAYVYMRLRELFK